jgi:sugar lactone lactonase YvrE
VSVRKTVRFRGFCAALAACAVTLLPGCFGGGSSSSTPFALYPVTQTVGNTPGSPGFLGSPSCCVILPNGDIIVTNGSVIGSVNSNNSLIKVYDPTGKYITTIGGVGSGPGQYVSPEGMATDIGGDLYVIDSGNARVNVYDTNFNFVRSFGNHSSLSDPEMLAVDSRGNCYIIDDFLSEVVVFDSTGALVTSYGNTAGPFQLHHPVSVAFNPNGNLDVCDTANHRIVEFSPAGLPIREFGDNVLKWPIGIALDQAGNIYVNDKGTGAVEEFDPKNNLIFAYQVKTPDPTANSIEGEQVTIDAHGNIWVAVSYASSNVLEELPPHH